MVRLDGHVHVWPTEVLPSFSDNMSIERSPTLLTLQNYLAAAGLDGAVLIQPSALGKDHTHITQCLEQFSDQFAGIGVLDVSWPAYDTMVEELRDAGISGFRLVAYHTPEFFLDCDVPRALAFLDRNNVPVSFLMLADQLKDLEALLANHNWSTPLIIDHMARLTLDHRSVEDSLRTLCRLATYENVYVKISALATLSTTPAPHMDLRPVVARLMESYGAERLIWGSDFPYVNGVAGYQEALYSIEELLHPYTRLMQQAVLADNARRLWW